MGELDSPALSATYAYDRRGLLTSSVDDDYVTTFGYDVDGNRTGVGYPSGQVVSYSFDFAGRPIAASSASSSFVTAASYLPFGPVASMTYGNGTTKTMQYDARYRRSENKLTTASAIIADYTYQSDAASNITQIHDAVDPTYNRDFGYDDLNRLTTANSGTSLWGTGTYQYDSMGNMTSLHIGSRSLTFAYDGTSPRLTSVSGSSPATVSYDAAGNEASLGTYSPRNFMTYVEVPSQSRNVYLEYDGRGVRVRATLFGPSGHGGRVASSRRSLYSPELHLLAQSDWSPDAAAGGTEYIWFGDQPVAQTFTDPTLPTRHTFTDHLGTPLLQTSSTGSVIWRAEYEPYGSVYSYRAGDVSDPQALRLPGQEVAEFSNSDKESAYNIFRWYSSGWGRYTQADLLGLAGDLNLYGYVNANPVRWSDSLGLITPVKPKDQAWRPCNSAEESECAAKCKYGMESCMVSRTWRVIRATQGKTVYGWVDGPMSCSCKEPDCWDKLKDWARQWTNPDPRPLPPMLPLPPFRPVPPLVPLPPPVWEPVPPTLIPPFINPCMLNPSLCYGQGGIA